MTMATCQTEPGCSWDQGYCKDSASPPPSANCGAFMASASCQTEPDCTWDGMFCKPSSAIGTPTNTPDADKDILEVLQPGSPCQMTKDADDGALCVSSGNFPNDYSIDEECDILVNGHSIVNAVFFSTEPGELDFVRIHDTKYTGKIGPEHVEVFPGDIIHWETDSFGTRPGWKLCIANNCTCANGEAVIGASCFPPNAEKCQSCNSMYTQDKDLCVLFLPDGFTGFRFEVFSTLDVAAIGTSISLTSQPREAMIQKEDDVRWTNVTIVTMHPSLPSRDGYTVSLLPTPIDLHPGLYTITIRTFADEWNAWHGAREPPNVVHFDNDVAQLQGSVHIAADTMTVADTHPTWGLVTFFACNVPHSGVRLPQRTQSVAVDAPSSTACSEVSPNWWVGGNITAICVASNDEGDPSTMVDHSECLGIVQQPMALVRGLQDDGTTNVEVQMRLQLGNVSVEQVGVHCTVQSAEDTVLDTRRLRRHPTRQLSVTENECVSGLYVRFFCGGAEDTVVSFSTYGDSACMAIDNNTPLSFNPSDCVSNMGMSSRFVCSMSNPVAEVFSTSTTCLGSSTYVDANLASCQCSTLVGASSTGSANSSTNDATDGNGNDDTTMPSTGNTAADGVECRAHEKYFCAADGSTDVVVGRAAGPCTTNDTMLTYRTVPRDELFTPTNIADCYVGSHGTSFRLECAMYGTYNTLQKRVYDESATCTDNDGTESVEPCACKCVEQVDMRDARDGMALVKLGGLRPNSWHSAQCIVSFPEGEHDLATERVMFYTSTRFEVSLQQCPSHTTDSAHLELHIDVGTYQTVRCGAFPPGANPDTSNAESFFSQSHKGTNIGARDATWEQALGPGRSVVQFRVTVSANVALRVAHLRFFLANGRRVPIEALSIEIRDDTRRDLHSLLTDSTSAALFYDGPIIVTFATPISVHAWDIEFEEVLPLNVTFEAQYAGVRDYIPVMSLSETTIGTGPYTFPYSTQFDLPTFQGYRYQAFDVICYASATGALTATLSISSMATHGFVTLPVFRRYEDHSVVIAARSANWQCTFSADSIPEFASVDERTLEGGCELREVHIPMTYAGSLYCGSVNAGSGKLSPQNVEFPRFVRPVEVRTRYDELSSAGGMLNVEVEYFVRSGRITCVQYSGFQTTIEGLNYTAPNRLNSSVYVVDDRRDWHTDEHEFQFILQPGNDYYTIVCALEAEDTTFFTTPEFVQVQSAFDINVRVDHCSTSNVNVTMKALEDELSECAGRARDQCMDDCSWDASFLPEGTQPPASTEQSGSTEMSASAPTTGSCRHRCEVRKDEAVCLFVERWDEEPSCVWISRTNLPSKCLPRHGDNFCFKFTPDICGNVCVWAAGSCTAPSAAPKHMRSLCTSLTLQTECDNRCEWNNVANECVRHTTSAGVLGFSVEPHVYNQFIYCSLFLRGSTADDFTNVPSVFERVIGTMQSGPAGRIRPLTHLLLHLRSDKQVSVTMSDFQWLADATFSPAAPHPTVRIANGSEVAFDGSVSGELLHTSECADRAGQSELPWKDDVLHDCQWYAENSYRCAQYSHIYSQLVRSSANITCCACGGGTANYALAWEFEFPMALLLTGVSFVPSNLPSPMHWEISRKHSTQYGYEVVATGIFVKNTSASVVFCAQDSVCTENRMKRLSVPSGWENADLGCFAMGGFWSFTPVTRASGHWVTPPTVHGLGLTTMTLRAQGTGSVTHCFPATDNQVTHASSTAEAYVSSLGMTSEEGECRDETLIVSFQSPDQRAAICVGSSPYSVEVLATHALAPRCQHVVSPVRLGPFGNNDTRCAMLLGALSESELLRSLHEFGAHQYPAGSDRMITLDAVYDGPLRIACLSADPDIGLEVISRQLIRQPTAVVVEHRPPTNVLRGVTSAVPGEYVQCNTDITYPRYITEEDNVLDSNRWSLAKYAEGACVVSLIRDAPSWATTGNPWVGANNNVAGLSKHVIPGGYVASTLTHCKQLCEADLNCTAVEMTGSSCTILARYAYRGSRPVSESPLAPTSCYFFARSQYVHERVLVTECNRFEVSLQSTFLGPFPVEYRTTCRVEGQHDPHGGDNAFRWVAPGYFGEPMPVSVSTSEYEWHMAYSDDRGADAQCSLEVYATGTSNHLEAWPHRTETPTMTSPSGTTPPRRLTPKDPCTSDPVSVALEASDSLRDGIDALSQCGNGTMGQLNLPRIPVLRGPYPSMIEAQLLLVCEHASHQADPVPVFAATGYWRQMFFRDTTLTSSMCNLCSSEDWTDAWEDHVSNRRLHIVAVNAHCRDAFGMTVSLMGESRDFEIFMHAVHSSSMDSVRCPRNDVAVSTTWSPFSNFTCTQVGVPSCNLSTPYAGNITCNVTHDNAPCTFASREQGTITCRTDGAAVGTSSIPAQHALSLIPPFSPGTSDIGTVALTCTLHLAHVALTASTTYTISTEGLVITPSVTIVYGEIGAGGLYVWATEFRVDCRCDVEPMQCIVDNGLTQQSMQQDGYDAARAGYEFFSPASGASGAYNVTCTAGASSASASRVYEKQVFAFSGVPKEACLDFPEDVRIQGLEMMLMWVGLGGALKVVSAECGSLLAGVSGNPSDLQSLGTALDNNADMELSLGNMTFSANAKAFKSLVFDVDSSTHRVPQVIARVRLNRSGEITCHIRRTCPTVHEVLHAPQGTYACPTCDCGCVLPSCTHGASCCMRSLRKSSDDFDTMTLFVNATGTLYSNFTFPNRIVASAHHVHCFYTDEPSINSTVPMSMAVIGGVAAVSPIYTQTAARGVLRGVNVTLVPGLSDASHRVACWHMPEASFHSDFSSMRLPTSLHQWSLVGDTHAPIEVTWAFSPPPKGTEIMIVCMTGEMIVYPQPYQLSPQVSVCSSPGFVEFPHPVPGSFVRYLANNYEIAPAKSAVLRFTMNAPDVVVCRATPTPLTRQSTYDKNEIPPEVIRRIEVQKHVTATLSFAFDEGSAIDVQCDTEYAQHATATISFYKPDGAKPVTGVRVKLALMSCDSLSSVNMDRLHQQILEQVTADILAMNPDAEIINFAVNIVHTWCDASEAMRELLPCCHAATTGYGYAEEDFATAVAPSMHRQLQRAADAVEKIEVVFEVLHINSASIRSATDSNVLLGDLKQITELKGFEMAVELEMALDGDFAPPPPCGRDDSPQLICDGWCGMAPMTCSLIIFGVTAAVVLCLMTILICWCRRKCRQPMAGQCRIGNNQLVTFNILRDAPDDGVSKPRTTIQWNIDHVKGHELGFDWQHWKSSSNADDERQSDVSPGNRSTRNEELDERVVSPSRLSHHSLESAISREDAMVPPPYQGFHVGERVELFSSSHQRWLPGTVSFCHSMMHAYDVRLGGSGQMRQVVEPSRIRLAAHPDEQVELWSVKTNSWVPGKPVRGATMRRMLREGDVVNCYVDRAWLRATLCAVDNEYVKATVMGEEMDGQDIEVLRTLTRVEGAPILSLSQSANLGVSEALRRTRTMSLPPEQWRRYSAVEAPSNQRRPSAVGTKRTGSPSPNVHHKITLPDVVLEFDNGDLNARVAPPTENMELPTLRGELLGHEGVDDDMSPMQGGTIIARASRLDDAEEQSPSIDPVAAWNFEADDKAKN
eukprot:GEMP01000050.1.p1 GENE.GEMP01000050.1~~GEMP01000050.1.p1  ORF type:complete len:3575 (+),score=694.56 GEMP01000050.1:1-10725(+)